LSAACSKPLSSVKAGCSSVGGYMPMDLPESYSTRTYSSKLVEEGCFPEFG
jgi:hypothetical protein